MDVWFHQNKIILFQDTVEKMQRQAIDWQKKKSLRKYSLVGYMKNSYNSVVRQSN